MKIKKTTYDCINYHLTLDASEIDTLYWILSVLTMENHGLESFQMTLIDTLLEVFFSDSERRLLYDLYRHINQFKS